MFRRSELVDNVFVPLIRGMSAATCLPQYCHGLHKSHRLLIPSLVSRHYYVDMESDE
jgi:hypothetical protein